MRKLPTPQNKMSDLARTSDARLSFDQMAERVGVLVFWICVWQLASLVLQQPLLLPGPFEVLSAFVALTQTQAFIGGICFSFERIASGFVLSFVLGIGLAALAFSVRPIRSLLSPLVSAGKSIPIVCVVVLLLLWVGSGEVSRIAVFLATFPAVFLSVLEALDAKDPKLSDLLKRMDVASWRCVLVDTWQQLLPFVVGTCKNACGMAWKAGVAAEVIGTPAGSLGQQVYQARLLLETPDLFAWTATIVLVAWVTEQLFMACVRLSGPLALKLALIGLTPKSKNLKATPQAQPQTQSGTPLIEARGLRVGYDRAHVLSNPMTFSARAGERLVMTEESGAGKTTLIKTVLGMIEQVDGEFFAQEPVGVMLQETLLVEAASAEKNVALIAGFECSAAEIHTMLEAVLPGVDLTRPVSKLSGGQRRRVEFVRAIARDVKLLVLDEPFASLDEGSRRRCIELLCEMRPQAAVLLASHDSIDKELFGARELKLRS